MRLRRFDFHSGSGPAAAAVLLALMLATPAASQTRLTLADAIARARSDTPDARVAAAAAGEAAERVREARAGYWPRLDVTESVQRGDQPVYVFSSLLSQRQFTAANFDVASLNHPDPITNVRTLVAVDQRVYDGGRTRREVRAAELDRDLADLTRSRSGEDLAMAAAESFVRVLQLESADRATQSAVAAAQSDLERARARRDAGLVTTADTLAADVHLADMRQRQIATAGDLAVARLELNDVLGLPLDEPLMLVAPASATEPPPLDGLIQGARTSRIDSRQAELQVERATAQREIARGAFLPSIGVQAAWDFNGATLSEQRSGWIAGAQIQINLFNGFADSARIAAASQAELRAIADRERVARRIDVDVRSAATRLETARARDAAGRTGLAQARESQRIIRDRYDSGLATITDVLRAAEAVLDAESRATTAQMNVILQTVALDRAAGRL